MPCRRWRKMCLFREVTVIKSGNIQTQSCIERWSKVQIHWEGETFPLSLGLWSGLWLLNTELIQLLMQALHRITGPCWCASESDIKLAWDKVIAVDSLTFVRWWRIPVLSAIVEVTAPCSSRSYQADLQYTRDEIKWLPVGIVVRWSFEVSEGSGETRCRSVAQVVKDSWAVVGCPSLPEGAA